MTIIVFMVAGMSSRFAGKPKQMAKVGPNNETLIEYSVKQALTCNFSKVIFITNPITEKLFVNIFGNIYNNIPIEYIEQKYDTKERLRPWGTTDAICSILDNVKDQFVIVNNDNISSIVNDEEHYIIVNGDDIYGENTFKKGFSMMEEKEINIIGGLKVIDTLPETGTVNRGIIFIEGENVIGLKEMLNISKEDNPCLHDELANVNFLGLQLTVLKQLKIILDKFKSDHKGEKKIECILTDNLDDLIKDGSINIKFFKITDEILGITNPGDEIIVKDILSKY